jgi:hypothetical protein
LEKDENGVLKKVPEPDQKAHDGTTTALPFRRFGLRNLPPVQLKLRVSRRPSPRPRTELYCRPDLMPHRTHAPATRRRLHAALDRFPGFQREIKVIFDSLDTNKSGAGFPETEEQRRQLKEVQLAKKPLLDEKNILGKEIRCARVPIVARHQSRCSASPVDVVRVALRVTRPMSAYGQMGTERARAVTPRAR